MPEKKWCGTVPEVCDVCGAPIKGKFTMDKRSMDHGHVCVSYVL